MLVPVLTDELVMGILQDFVRLGHPHSIWESPREPERPPPLLFPAHILLLPVTRCRYPSPIVDIRTFFLTYKYSTRPTVHANALMWGNKIICTACRSGCAVRLNADGTVPPFQVRLAYHPLASTSLHHCILC